MEEKERAALEKGGFVEALLDQKGCPTIAESDRGVGWSSVLPCTQICSVLKPGKWVNGLLWL